MLPDTGERYLSTPLFEDIAAEMSAEELEISKSTPNFRFDVPPSKVPEDPPALERAPTPASRDFVATVLADDAQPVVMFALSWCEFCWAVRKLFARCGIAYHSVDLDSIEYQRDDWGGAVRAALVERTSIRTIPQIFVGGELVGGATEVFQSFGQGRLQALLLERGVPFEDNVGDDLFSLMPGWVQQPVR